MNEVVHYILSFLLYGNESAIEQVRYAPEVEPDSNAPVTILGDGLDVPLHYPDLSEPHIEHLPNGHVVIHCDWVYNTFFFISRAEEVLNTRRDQHDRFLARYSQLSANDWQIPLIDEYSRSLMKLLGLALPEPGFSGIHLTHDIDILTSYRHLRGALGGIRRGQWEDVISSWTNIDTDPVYTFPWMIEQDAKVKNAEVIYFIKHTSGRGLDYPQYNLHGKDYLFTSKMLIDSGAQLGLHSSAYATYPIPHATLHRSHYLACSIDRMEQLIAAGIQHDYTMGFADRAGFRLQTTRAVKWINPLTHQLTPLTLHPLTIMDCTLSNNQYMNLTEDEAYFYAAKLIDTVRLHHGEVNLLWHNSIFYFSYHQSLYPKILSLL